MTPPLKVALPRLALRIALIIALIWLLRLGYDALYARISSMEEAMAERAMFWLTVAAVLAYAIMIAIPFVPAIEIGIGLLIMEGASIAPFVYGATVLGLYLAYWIGRSVSLRWLHGFFADLRMRRACRMIAAIKNRPPATRLRALQDRLPKWISPWAVRYRYLTIAILLNVPGNAVIGGGGGILMVAGLSRLFAAPWVFLTLALCVLPIPLAVWIWGSGVLGQ